MPRTYLVDAHNALYRLFDAPPANADEARRLVVERAGAAVRARGAGRIRAHLVFDTTPAGRIRAGSHGRDGDVTWSYAAGSADEEILRLVRENEGRDGANAIVVVTDDRELRGRASQLGVATEHVAAFFAPPREAPPAKGGAAGPPMRPEDFGFTSGSFDLDHFHPDDL